MGENANVSWDWHNTVVGEGYQARGVVRQAGVKAPSVQIVDMRQAPGDKYLFYWTLNKFTNERFPHSRKGSLVKGSLVKERQGEKGAQESFQTGEKSRCQRQKEDEEDVQPDVATVRSLVI